MKGTHICVTGKLFNYTRAQVEEAINSVGAIMDKSVTMSTDYLVTNNKKTNTTKMRAAQRYGTKVIDETTLMIMLLQIMGDIKE